DFRTLHTVPTRRSSDLLSLTHTQEGFMAKVLVLYYSAYGHIETMAKAVAEGAAAAGAEVDIKRVPELVPEDVARTSHYKVDQDRSEEHTSELQSRENLV